MPRRSVSTLLVAVVSLLALAVTGCTGPASGSTGPSATKSAEPTPEPTVAPSGDGILRIGTLFPMTGEGAASGAAQVAGTELAAREILEQGGVRGQPIELVHRNSVGDVAAATADFLARGVDVILWDASVLMPEPAAEAVVAGPVALLQLRDFVNPAAPYVADEVFSARLRTADPTLAGFAGGAEAYDGVIMTALAVTVFGDDGGPSIEVGWASLLAGTTPCTSWGECLLALTETRVIGYAGVTGPRSS